VLACLNAAPVDPVVQKDVKVRRAEVRATRERLERLLTLGLRVPIERRFPLDKGAEAYEISRSGHARGKLVLQIS
jgi:NADPH:quinone reductase-like Zn-dependent oxidoreductase